MWFLKSDFSKLLKHTKTNLKCTETKTFHVAQVLFLLWLSTDFMVRLVIFRGQRSERVMRFLAAWQEWCTPGCFRFRSNTRQQGRMCPLPGFGVQNKPHTSPHGPCATGRPGQSALQLPPPSWPAGSWARASGPGAQRSDPAGQLFHHLVFSWPFPVPEEFLFLL